MWIYAYKGQTRNITAAHSILYHLGINRAALHLVVVAIGDGVGVHAGLLHLKEDPHCQDGLSILSTQLHQHPVADLHTTRA